MKFISILEILVENPGTWHTKIQIFQSRNRVASRPAINRIPHLSSKVKEKSKNRELTLENSGLRTDMDDIHLGGITYSVVSPK